MRSRSRDVKTTHHFPGAAVSSAFIRASARGAWIGLVGGALAVLGGCIRDKDSDSEMQPRTASVAPGSFKKNATSSERFRGDEPHGASPHGASPHGSQEVDGSG